MSWSRRYAIRSYLLSTVWIAPVLALVLEQLTFRIAYAYQLDLGWFPGFAGGTRDGTIAIADYVISSSIAFIVFTFSSLIVAMQVASGQLTPRIIATALLRDNVIRGSVAVFVYALLIAIAVKTRVDTIPRSLVSMTGILGLLSVLIFMFLIDHAARFLRPVNIVWRIAQQGLLVIDDVYPILLAVSSTAAQKTENLGPPEREIQHGHSSAIIIAVNTDALAAEAKRADAIIELVPRVGDFVAKNDLLFQLRGRGAARIDERFLRNQVAFGRERTIEQDSTFAFRVIVDIAIKALSSAINDPTTAVISIDQLQRLLYDVGSRYLRGEAILDATGQPRLILRTPNWEDFVQLSCSEIRCYGASNLQIARKLQAMLLVLMHELPQYRAPALQREMDLLNQTLDGNFELPADRELAGTADSQGLGGRLYH